MSSYFVEFANHNSIVIKVEADANRPDNGDDVTVLENWLIDNYGYAQYKYTQIDNCEIVNL